MVVSSTNANVPSAPPPFSNRFQVLQWLQNDEETTKPHSEFKAKGKYVPPQMRKPQMRIPSESAASTTGLDPMTSSTSDARPTHGSSLDREKKGTSRPHIPHVSSVPGSTVLEFGEMKKIHEELLNVRKEMEEVETIEKELLEEARFEQESQVVRNAGLTDEEIREMMGWSPANSQSMPPSVKPLDVNVSICFRDLVSGRDLTWVRQGLGIDLARINLGSEQEDERLEKTHETGLAQQTEEDLTNKTPIPGGPMYSSVNHPRSIHQTGNYGHFIPSTTPANNAHRDTFARHATGWKDQVQAYPGITGCHGSISSGTFQVPGQIYQTPGAGFNASVDSLPPRFHRPPIYHQSVPLRYPNAIPNWSWDVSPVGHPVLPPPIPSQPQSSTLNRGFRPVTIPPPPRPYSYEADFVFNFEEVALSSNCDRDHFVRTYCRTSGLSPSHAAWAAWGNAVKKVKRAQKAETLKAMMERHGGGSRLLQWRSTLLEDLPGSELNYSSSSSDASTKVASSRNSEVSDGESMVESVVGVPRDPKGWKDVADITWMHPPGCRIQSAT